MRIRLPDQVKDEITRRWMRGEQRDKIAGDMGLGAGTVTAVISEWRASIGRPEANALRQFAVELRRSGISPLECALGYRTINTIKKLGIDEEALHLFVSTLYNKCKYYNINSSNLVAAAIQIINLLDQKKITKIEDYLYEKAKEKEKLSREVEELVEQKQDAQTRCSQALQEQQITMKTLKEIAFFKRSLEQYSISTTNLSNLVNALNSAKDFGYNPVTIGENISRLTSIQEQYKVMVEMNDTAEKDNEKLADQANELEKRVNELKKDKSRLEEMSFENARKFIGELTQDSKKDIKELSDFAIEKIRTVSEKNDQTTDRAINTMKSVETVFQNILSQLKILVTSKSDK